MNKMINRAQEKRVRLIRECPRFQTSELINRDGEQVVDCKVCGLSRHGECIAFRLINKAICD